MHNHQTREEALEDLQILQQLSATRVGQGDHRALHSAGPDFRCEPHVHDRQGMPGPDGIRGRKNNHRP